MDPSDRRESWRTTDSTWARSLSAALWGLRRGPGVLGLVAKDRLHLGALQSPVASCDLGLELTRCPAGVADEDPQTVDAIVAAKQLQQQLLVRAQVDSVTGLDGVLGRRGGAKQEPHGPEVNGSAEVHLVAHLREAVEIGKKTRDRNRHRPVDDDADRGGTEVVHHEHNRVREIGIGQVVSRYEENCG